MSYSSKCSFTDTPKMYLTYALILVYSPNFSLKIAFTCQNFPCPIFPMYSKRITLHSQGIVHYLTTKFSTTPTLNPTEFLFHYVAILSHRQFLSTILAWIVWYTKHCIWFTKISSQNTSNKDESQYMLPVYVPLLLIVLTCRLCTWNALP